MMRQRAVQLGVVTRVVHGVGGVDMRILVAGEALSLELIDHGAAVATFIGSSLCMRAITGGL